MIIACSLNNLLLHGVYSSMIMFNLICQINLSMLPTYAGAGEILLHSSSLNNVACRTYPLAFYCRATGSLNGLFWSLNDSVIHEYTAFDNKRVDFHNETNSYSALYRNVRGPDIHESNLVFLDLPRASFFKITCIFAGSDKSMNITVIGE